MNATIIPVSVLTTLGFLGGTLFGALALGDLSHPVAEQTTNLPSTLGLAQAVSDRDGARPVQPPTDVAVAKPAAGPAETPGEDPRIGAVLASWQAAEARIADLQTRLTNVERAIAERPKAQVSEGSKGPQTLEERRDLLVAAGVSLELAEDVLWRESRVELERLNLRDQAIREGWMGSDRYREAVNALAEESGSLREEIGDPAWDRYLYLTGEDNRLSISSVIPGSAAEVAGLQSGDLIESYAGIQPFGFNDLRQATTEGEKGELVAVRIRRGDRLLDAWVPRGPLGVRLGTARAEPLP